MSAEVKSKQRVLPISEIVLDKLGRNAGIGVAIVLLLMFVMAIGQSAEKLLWWDELITVKTASLPQWGQVWTFFASGLDTTGPMSSLIARIGLELPVDPEIGSRLLFTLAYLVMCCCIYAFMRRRYPVGYALAALIYPMHRPIFYYATEARSYVLVLAGASVAMLSWQAAVIGRHRRWGLFGLWFGLAFAINAHAFAVFLSIPFALAQFVEDFRRKKPDWAIWTAILLFPIGILPVLHGELLAGKIYASSFWSHPELQSILPMYQEFFFSYLSYLTCLVLVAVAAFLLRNKSWITSSKPKMSGLTRSEWVFAAVLALLPLYEVLAAYPLHIYAPRYALSFNIGLIVLAIAAVAEAARRNRLAGAVLFALFLIASTRHRAETFIDGLHALVHPDRVHQQLQAQYDNLAWVRILDESGLPVVADDVNPYSQLEFYGTPGLKSRLFAITYIRDVKKYPYTATNQLNFLVFGKQLSYRVADVNDFARSNPHFLLIESAGKNMNKMWMPKYLLDQQRAGSASVACLASDCVGPGPNVYDVQFTAMPAQGENAVTPNLAHTP